MIAAVCQLDDQQGEPARALQVIAEAAAAAVQRGAQVVCIPEAFLSGYTRDSAIARERAVSLESPGFRSVSRRLSAVAATLILGVIETDGDELFNTAAVITAGRLIGRYRKRHPVEDCFSPGHALPVFAVGSVEFGIGICSDGRDATDASALRANGASAIFYLLNNMLPHPTANRWRHRHATILRSRAREAGVWVLAADVIGQRDDHQGYGCTIAVDPDGVIIDRVREHTTGIAYAEISPQPDPSKRP